MRINSIGCVAALALTFLACASPQTNTATQPGAVSGAKSAIGGPCGSDGECEQGLSCDKADPGGQCQKACASNADCGAGAVCGGEKKCYHACKSADDCRKGYTCMGKAPDTFCDVAEEKEEHH